MAASRRPLPPPDWGRGAWLLPWAAPRFVPLAGTAPLQGSSVPAACVGARRASPAPQAHHCPLFRCRVGITLTPCAWTAGRGRGEGGAACPRVVPAPQSAEAFGLGLSDPLVMLPPPLPPGRCSSLRKAGSASPSTTAASPTWWSGLTAEWHSGPSGTRASCRRTRFPAPEAAARPVPGSAVGAGNTGHVPCPPSAGGAAVAVAPGRGCGVEARATCHVTSSCPGEGALGPRCPVSPGPLPQAHLPGRA